MRSRYPPLRKVDGKYVCRGCGGVIPKGRQTWCSNKCFKEHDPHSNIRIVRQRDKDVCAKCGFNYPVERAKWLEGPRLWQDCPRKVEYHHVIPFSEGGSHHPDNIQTLCHACHKAVTAAWRKSKRITLGKQLTLELI